MGIEQGSRRTESERERWKIASLKVFYPLSPDRQIELATMEMYIDIRHRSCVSCTVSHRPFRLSQFFCSHIPELGCLLFDFPPAADWSTKVNIKRQEEKSEEWSIGEGYWEWLNENHTRWWTANTSNVRTHTPQTTKIYLHTIAGRHGPNGRTRFGIWNLIGTKRLSFACLRSSRKKKINFLLGCFRFFDAFVFILFSNLFFCSFSLWVPLVHPHISAHITMYTYMQ